MSAATDFRRIRLSRETYEWLLAGLPLLRTIAADYESEGVDTEPLEQVAYACQTVVDEWSAQAPTDEETEYCAKCRRHTRWDSAGFCSVCGSAYAITAEELSPRTSAT